MLQLKTRFLFGEINHDIIHEAIKRRLPKNQSRITSGDKKFCDNNEFSLVNILDTHHTTIKYKNLLGHLAVPHG